MVLFITSAKALKGLWYDRAMFVYPTDIILWNFTNFIKPLIETNDSCSLFVSKLSHILHSGPMMSMFFLSANISTSDQLCFNVVDQRWNNVDPTLKMKQNPTSDFQRCTTLIQRQCPTLKQRRNNVTQRRNSVDTMLFQPSVDVSESYIESNRASDDYGFANRWIVFILLNEETFLLYINNSTTNEISKHFLTVIHIVTHNDGNNGDIQRRLKYCTQNFKTSLKNMKI